jgi:hypothetical protein
MVDILTGAKKLRLLTFESPKCSSDNFESERDWNRTVGRVLSLFSHAITGGPNGDSFAFQHLRGRKWSATFPNIRVARAT